MATAQVRLGHLLERRLTPSTVAVGDRVWLDSKHTPVDIPYKLTARWFGPSEVTEMHGAQFTLDLPETFGKAHRKVNIRRLEGFQSLRCVFWGSLRTPHTSRGTGWCQ